jgi:uncharacterized protein YcfL
MKKFALITLTSILFAACAQTSTNSTTKCDSTCVDSCKVVTNDSATAKVDTTKGK